MKNLNFLIIGAGSRGNAYARAITSSTPGRIAAVAEPDPYKRRLFGETYIWGSKSAKQGQEFDDWRAWIEYEVRRRSGSQNLQDNKDNKQEEEDDEEEERIHGLLICTLDHTHIDILTALTKNNLSDLHVLCEKPLALSLSDCLTILAARQRATQSIFSIGHVLRYSPHNLLLRRLVRHDRVIGDIVSVEHVEPVGYWHFAHSYVRGNWRHHVTTTNTGNRKNEDETEEKGAGTLLTKSCHDIDFLLWLIESESDTTSSSSSSDVEKKKVRLRTISSTGHLSQFHRRRKPASAGTATNCLSCPIERECVYSAVRIYRDMHLARGDTAWPVKIVVPDIEEYPLSPLSTTETSNLGSNSNLDGNGISGGSAGLSTGVKTAEDRLLERLGEDYDSTTSPEDVASRPWYGRCVWECDNDVCDDQVVTLSWDTTTDTDTDKAKGSGVTALFHMIAPTEKQCERRGRIYGTHGEISYDSRRITIYSFSSGESTVVEVPRMAAAEEEEAHGGGDYGLARGFVRAVEAVEREGWSVSRAQREFVGCDVEEVVRSHAVVFAAEEARRGEVVVRWGEWWEGKLRGGWD